MKRVITFGTFDVFHVGHLRLLKRAREIGDELVVGISTDELTFKKKGRYPVFPLNERMDIVAAIQFVHTVFEEESLEEKKKYIERYSADTLVMGDDWSGKFDQFNSICEVVYLSRTPAISTTAVIEKIRI